MKKKLRISNLGTRRRDFIKIAALSGIGISLAPHLSFGTNLSSKTARIGFIGVGGRGRNHLQNILNRKDVIVPAFCDIDPEANIKTQNFPDFTRGRWISNKPIFAMNNDEY